MPYFSRSCYSHTIPDMMRFRRLPPLIQLTKETNVALSFRLDTSGFRSFLSRSQNFVKCFGLFKQPRVSVILYHGQLLLA